MAGPVASFVQLPDDSSNAGKKIRTQTRVVGANTVHEHYFVTASSRLILGRYYFVSTLLSVQVSAQNGTSTGFFWLQMPVGSNNRGRLRKLLVEQCNLSAIIADLSTSPRILLTRFTFTGTASGAQITPCLRRSDDATAAATVRTAVTGMTVTVGAPAQAIMVPAVNFTTSGVESWKNYFEFAPVDEEDFLDFDAGQGFLLYQPDAGTTADTRRFVVSGEWDEYDDS